MKVTQRFTDRNETMQAYLQEVSHLNPLSSEEEAELARVIKKGGREALKARNRLVESNLRFVITVAKQYTHYGIDLEDLINEGNIGMIMAAEKFDDERNIRFCSYAVWYVRQRILQALAERGRMVRLPSNQNIMLSRINKAICDFEQLHQRRPTDTELAEITDIDAVHVAHLRGSDRTAMSIDTTFSEEESGTFGDTLAADANWRADRESDHESLNQSIDLVLRRTLNDREVSIIRMNYGLGCPESGLEEIGMQLDLSRERVRQIREKAITKLRKSNSIHLLREYIGMAS